MTVSILASLTTIKSSETGDFFFFNVRVNSRWSRDQRFLGDFKVASLIGPIHVKVYGLLLKKNHLLGCCNFLSLINLIWGSFIVYIANTAYIISMNLPYDLVCSTVVVPGHVLLAFTWIC